MIFRLWHKLVLTIIGITGIVLISALFISDRSVKKGFLAYINQVEANRLDSLVENLTQGYLENNSWEFIRDNHRLWHRYNRRSNSPLPLYRENSTPSLHTIASRESDGTGRYRGERPHHRPPPHYFEKPNKNRPPIEEDRSQKRSPPHHRGPKRIPKGLVLLDSNKEFVVGKTKTIFSGENVLRPINLDDQIIGYLQFEPFTKFTEELDQQFIQYQNHAFLKIALMALAVVLAGAALFAAYLRFRINKIGDHAGLLTSGDFSPQHLDASRDEIGQLSKKLDILGKTLADNQLSRRRWVSDISHELRTPVAVLQGEIEGIIDGVRKMNTDSLHSLHQETLRLSRLVDDLYQLSLSDMGALNYEKEPLNIVEVVSDILDNYRHTLAEKEISVALDISDNELIVEGDSQRLEQLFVNLAVNSQHYTSHAGSLNVSIKKHAGFAVIEWSDSAPGVSDEQLEKLFDRLYRVEASRNRNEGGSGLGLSISKNIVEAHAGEISATHSSLGGIAFIIKLPLQTT